MLRHAILIVGLAIAAPASAQDNLRKVAATNDRVYYVYTNTVEDGREFGVTIRSAWFKYDHDGGSARPPGTTKTFDIFDCKGRRSSTQEIIDYKKDGTVFKSHSYDTVSWRRVVPGSIGESKLIYMCGET